MVKLKGSLTPSETATSDISTSTGGRDEYKNNEIVMVKWCDFFLLILF